MGYGQQIANETNVGGSSSGAWVASCGGDVDSQGSVWGIDQGVLSDIQLLLNVIESRGQRQGTQFAWSAPAWSWTLRKTFSSHDAEKGTIFFWCDPSSVGAHVAPGQDCCSH